MKRLLLFAVALVALARSASGSLVPINTDTVKRSIVFLYSADANGQPDRTHEVGTAFLVEIPLKAQPTRSYFALVTARHIVDPTWACLGLGNPANLYARVSKKTFDPQHDESGVVFIKLVLVTDGRRTWATHPRETIDVAVIPIQPDDFLSHDVATVRVSDFGTPEENKSVGIGDDVISAGLVPGYSGQLRNYPFFKFGKVSNIPAEDTLVQCQGQQPKPKTFWYVAATLVPGNSGSPVFLLPPGNAIMHFGNARPFLLGLQSISIVAGEIAGITPSQFIFDVIESLHLPDADLSRGPRENAPANPKCTAPVVYTSHLMSLSPSLSTAREAQKLLAQYLPVTPAVAARSLSSNRTSAYLKLETTLPTGSFKPRGALYALATHLAQRSVQEVTASSTGNHGAAVAFAAKTLGVPATIFLPAHANPVKRQKILDLGARVVEQGAADLAEAFALASEYSRRPGVYFLNDATEPVLPAGPAVIALEIFEQVPQVSSIYVPMGDTALIRGLAAAAKQLAPRTRIVGVQAERAPSYYLSWKEGRAVPTDTCDTCADGLATRTPDPQNVLAIRELVDDVLLVSEEQMLQAIAHLYREEGVLAEPAGAAATAAFLSDTKREGSAVLLVTGANISDEVKRRAGLL